MKQLTLDLQNYRKFKTLHLDFHPRFTLLMGVNGTGKTSVLHGIWRSWQPMIASANAGGSMPTLNEVHQQASIDVSSESWLTSQFPLRTIGDFIWDGFTLEGVGVALSDSTNSGTSLRLSSGSQLAIAVKMAFRANTPIPLLARFGATKPQPAGETGGLKKPFSERKDVWALAQSDEVQSAQLTSWFQYYELRGLQEKETPLLLKLARKAVLAAIHAEDISFIIRENALMVRHADVGWRKFSDLSDGQQRIAAIFCDLAMRCASLNSHLGEKAIEETPGVVTIDELDLHLHPQWQRTVIQDLLSVFPKLQFIATSHSPFLLQAAFAQGTVIDLGTGQAVTAPDESIEDIAEHVMGVHPFPQRSQRWHDMKAVAAEYYRLLEVAKQSADSDEVRAVKSRLDALIIPYTDDPAYAAWLEMHRAAAGV
jgi:predicted ATP-binding protein involved in virulence